MSDAIALLNALEADLEEATRASEAEQQREKALDDALQTLIHRSDTTQREAAGDALRKLYAQEKETKAEITQLQDTLSTVVTDFDQRLSRETKIDKWTPTDGDGEKQRRRIDDIQEQIAIRQKELAALARLRERYHKASEALRPTIHSLTAQLRKKLKDNQNQEQLLRKLRKEPATAPHQRRQDKRSNHEQQRFQKLYSRQTDSKRANASSKAVIAATALVPVNEARNDAGQRPMINSVERQDVAVSDHEEDFSLSD